MAYAFLFAGIGESVMCAGISAYGLKINMLHVVIVSILFKIMCRSCLAL